MSRLVNIRLARIAVVSSFDLSPHERFGDTVHTLYQHVSRNNNSNNEPSPRFHNDVCEQRSNPLAGITTRLVRSPLAVYPPPGRKLKSSTRRTPGTIVCDVLGMHALSGIDHIPSMYHVHNIYRICVVDETRDFL